jgi:hypothetical protein
MERPSVVEKPDDAGLETGDDDSWVWAERISPIATPAALARSTTRSTFYLALPAPTLTLIHW